MKLSVSSLQAAKSMCDISSWTITNLQLQKLLYLAHMVCLGRRNEPLIANENFSAWMYGPVLPSVYDRAKIFGMDFVCDRFYATSVLDDSTVAYSLLKEIYDFFGHKEGWQLVAATHSPNGAWAKHYKPGRNVTIPNDDILEEYNTRIRKYDG